MRAMTRSARLWLVGLGAPALAVILTLAIFPGARDQALALGLVAAGAVPALLLLVRVEEELAIERREVVSRSRVGEDLGVSLEVGRETATKQLGAIEETAASMHEMTASLRQIAHSVETLAASAEESSSSIL